MRALRAAAALALSSVACIGPSTAEIGTAASFNILRFAPHDREAAPPIEGEMLAGDPVRVEGAVAVVNFWGSWCGPCREEQPRLEALWKRFAARDVVFVGVNTRRDQRTAALAFLEEFDVSYPSIYDPESSIAADFAVVAMPSTFVIDRQGRIAVRITGAVRDADELATIITEELSP